MSGRMYYFCGCYMTKNSEQSVLAIDQGNTLVKMALFQGSRLIHILRIAENDSEGIIKAFDELLMLAKNHTINYTILSSVSSPPDFIHEALKGRAHIFDFSYQMSLPVNIRYKTTETLGKDRVAASCAGVKLFSGFPVLTIDAGTCITYDLVTASGDYLGGSISPGLRMRFKALHTFTHNLPFIEPEDDVPLIGDSTQGSILSGVINGVIQEMNGIIGQYMLKYPKLKLILTGGDTNYFEKKLNYNIFANPNLVLIGLRDIILYHVEK